MANRTVKDAHTIHGTNPQYLIEKIIRSRIYECRYWKEECFAVNEELLVERAAALKYIGGVHGGNIQPTPFLCLVLKMLQIQPAKDIVIEFIKQQDYKYARALGVFYLRLTHDSLECYRYLEPLFNDYRKLKRIDRQGAFGIVHMDEFVDELLREERSCDVILPRVQRRHVLEEDSELQPRVSLLDEELQDIRLSDLDDDGEAEEDPPSPPSPSPPPQRRPSPPPRRPTAQLQEERRHQRQRRSRSPRRPSPPPPPPPPPSRDRRRRSRSRSRSRSGSNSRSRHARRRSTSRDRRQRRRRSRSAASRSPTPEQPERRRDSRKRQQQQQHRRSASNSSGELKRKKKRKKEEKREDKKSAKDKKRERRKEEKRQQLLQEGAAAADHDDPEIREANRLRAELGIPLLKP